MAACFAALDTTTKFVSISRAAADGAVVPLRLPGDGDHGGRAAAARHGAAAHARTRASSCCAALLLLVRARCAFFEPAATCRWPNSPPSCMIAPLADHRAGRARCSRSRCRRCAGRWWRAASPARWSSSGRAAGLQLGQPAAAGGWSLTNAWFQVLTSKLARTEDPLTMHLYTGLGRHADRLDRAAVRAGRHCPLAGRAGCGAAASWA